MKRTAERRVRWDAAHRIPDHESKCRDLHGHGYFAVITAEAEELDDLSRVVDFGVLKRFQKWVDENWDHATLLWKDDAVASAALAPLGGKVFELPRHPTAETLAAYLLELAPEILADVAGVAVVKVRVEETPNCSAEVTRG